VLIFGVVTSLLQVISMLSTYFVKFKFLIFYLSFIVFCLTMAGDDNTKPKFCARCGHRHEGPTGKRRCKRPLDADFEAVTEESTPEVLVMAADDRLSTLVSVMSQLADRMDAQQIQLNQLQEVLSGPAPPPVAVPTAESGAIPKRLPASSGSCASEVNRSSFPDLATLRDDPAAVAQATTMIDGLDLGPTGTVLSSGSSAGVRSMRRAAAPI
jgi:hypothetical protein